MPSPKSPSFLRKATFRCRPEKSEALGTPRQAVSLGFRRRRRAHCRRSVMRHRPAVVLGTPLSFGRTFPAIWLRIFSVLVVHRYSPWLGLLSGILDPRRLTHGWRLEAVGVHPKQNRRAATRPDSPATRRLHLQADMCESVSSTQHATDAWLCQGVLFARKISLFEKKLIEAVRKKREVEGLSIRALSTAIGVSFSTLARIERGEGQPDNNSKIRLLEWLGADAESAGLSFDNVAFVHFRAGKNIRSSTVRALLRAAECLRQSIGGQGEWRAQQGTDDNVSAASVSLSKEELEEAAKKFRADLGLTSDEPLDSLRIEVEGVQVIPVGKTNYLDARNHKSASDGSWQRMVRNDRPAGSGK